MSDGQREKLSLLIKRENFLTALESGTTQMRDLVDVTGQSRSTVNRAIRELEEAGWARRTGEGYELTPTGQLSLSAYESFRSKLTAVNDAADLLAPIDEVSLEPALLVDAEFILAEGAAVFRPLAHLHERLDGAVQVKAVLPALASARTIQKSCEIATNGGSLEFVVSPALWHVLTDRFKDKLAPAVERGALRIAVGEVSPIGLFLTEGETTGVTILVFDDHSVHGAVISDSDDALDWAEQRFASLWESAEVRTSDLTE